MVTGQRSLTLTYSTPDSGLTYIISIKKSLQNGAVFIGPLCILCCSKTKQLTAWRNCRLYQKLTYIKPHPLLLCHPTLLVFMGPSCILCCSKTNWSSDVLISRWANVRCMLNEHTFLKGNSKINFYQIFSIAIQLYLQNDKVAFLKHPMGASLCQRQYKCFI